jgi:hypothetical protein
MFEKFFLKKFTQFYFQKSNKFPSKSTYSPSQISLVDLIDFFGNSLHLQIAQSARNRAKRKQKAHKFYPHFVNAKKTSKFGAFNRQIFRELKWQKLTKFKCLAAIFTLLKCC